VGTASIGGTVVTAPFPSSVSVTRTTLSAPINGAGAFQLNAVPAGDVELVFNSSGSSSALSVSDVNDQDVIDLQVGIIGGVATVLRETRGNQGKVVLCHRGDTGYHTIDVSVNAESAHRGHGDAKPGEQVPGDLTKVFDASCRLISPVAIKKFTNDQDADVAPGPTIPPGSTVTWTYVVTNQSALTFSSLSVVDDRGVGIACPKVLPAPGSSITCTGSGTATAGQYRNVGTATVTANATTFTASDASHYFGGP
jgi:hypothetical protein